jgi:WXG100 family type VII secretion target
MSGFDGITVQHGRLDQGSADVMSAAKDIEARLDQLESDLKPLRSDWTGSAKSAYDEAKATWDKAIADMILLLQDASAGVDTSNAEYKAADQRGAGRF